MKSTTREMTKNWKRYYLRPLVGLALLSVTCSVLPVLAAGTPAGLTIDNTANGSFENPNDPGTAIPVNSNTVTLTVSEIAGIDVTRVGATEAPFGVANSGPGQGDGAISSDDVVYFEYTITNIGNDPTQFFIPGAPSNVINGDFNIANIGPIEIIEYDDGINPPVPLNVAVPAGGDTTGNLIPAQNGGSLPVKTPTGSESITVRVPIKVNSDLDVNTDTVTVVLGNTNNTDGDGNTFADVNSQNTPYTDGGEFGTPAPGTDVFTVDNTGTANNDASGNSPDPEREASDVIVTPLGTPNVDYGDAPDADGPTAEGNYETLPGRGPSHIVDNTNFLGDVVDADGAFQDGGEDDGVEQGGTVLEGQTFELGQTITLDVETSNGSAGFLNAWIDFNRDGDFDDPGEQVATNAQPTADKITINTTVPLDATEGTTYARFRYSTAQNLNPTGSAPDGEVEDYSIILNSTPEMRLVKRITRVGATDFDTFVDDGTADNDDNSPNWPVDYLEGQVNTDAEPGEEVEYTIYFMSDGNTPINNIRLCDLIPENTTYVANSLFINLSGAASDTLLTDAADADAGESFNANAPAPCLTPNNGGVFVEIPGPLDNATGPATPDSYGYIRFTVVVD